MHARSYQYIVSTQVKNVEAATRTFFNYPKTPESFLEGLKRLLPLHKYTESALMARVEGLFIVVEMLLEYLVESNSNQNRMTVTSNQIIEKAALRPMNSYKGSIFLSEEVFLLSMEDCLNDPLTSMVKLKDDILLLGRLIRDNQAGDISSEHSLAV